MQKINAVRQGLLAFLRKETVFPQSAFIFQFRDNDVSYSSSTGTSFQSKLPNRGLDQNKKSLVKILSELQNWGIDQKVAKKHWRDGNFYIVTKVQPTKKLRGDVWGIFFNKGRPLTGTEQKIGGSSKREWKVVAEEEPNPNLSTEI